MAIGAIALWATAILGCATPSHQPAANHDHPAAAPAENVTIATDEPGRAMPVPPKPIELRELFPGVRADLAQRIVEFDAKTSPMLVEDPRAPMFYVETIVCLPDTREHESLLVTSVKPSHIHAALLAAGFSAGKPGTFTFADNKFSTVNPEGDRLSVEFVVTSAEGAGEKERAFDPRDWIVHHSSGAIFGFDGPDEGQGWVFAGSTIRKTAKGDLYDADGTGVVIGLCCFGSETIAWSRTFSHDASIDEPEWIARFTDVPAPGTPVRVRIRPMTAAK